jgi:ADP-ribose pyrophosphatase YjhB (NUDIX family)
MTRSRIAVLVSSVVVVLGLVAGLGALWLGQARAAVGPMPGEALVLPADSRFVMGFDVKRFTASPFYARFASERGMQPEALRELEEKTGLDPARDIDQIVVAGSPTAGKAGGVVMVFGRFDTYKLGRAMETEGKAVGHNVGGVSVYGFKEDDAHAQPLALALLDETHLLFGPRAEVEAAVGSRTRGETPLRTNAALLGLVEKVRPGSTFWMVGDQSLLAGMPAAVPAPGGAEGATVSLPALKSLTVTGDLDPQVSLNLTGEAADEPAAKNLADVVRGFVALMSLQSRQKPELQQLASAVTVATEQNRVLVSARVPYELLDALRAQAKPGAVSPAPEAAPKRTPEAAPKPKPVPKS